MEENQNYNQNLTPPPVQVTSEAKKWYQHKALLAVAILAVVAGMAVWVYLILNKPQDLGPVVVNHKTATSTSATSLKGWKTYTNQQYGFEFQYPQYLEDITDQEDVVSLASLFSNPQHISIQMVVDRLDNPQQLDIQIFLKRSYEDCIKNDVVMGPLLECQSWPSPEDISQLEKITISGHPALRSKSLAGDPDGPASVYIQAGNSILPVWFDFLGSEADKKNYEQDFDKIFSTFKFIK